ncbi:MAG: DUF4349 domain-containing protein [Hyphomonadaceae bacterium]
MAKHFWIAAAALALAACDGGGGRYAPSEDAAFAPDAVMEESGFSAPAAAPMPARAKLVEVDQTGGGGPSPQTGEPDVPADSRQLAYTYNYGFAVPTGQLEALFNAQRAACDNAGPANCYVVGSNIYGLGQETASGYIQLKASKAWVDAFKAGLDKSLEPFGATLDSSNSTAEDLTAQIIDTSATLTSAKTLRERLQKLLAERPGKLSDLLEIERELARVQQQIDSTESILAAMKLRVAMSTVTLNYSPKYSAVSESVWRPLGDAFANFVPNVARSLADLVEWLSQVLLGLAVLAVIAWLLIPRILRRIRKAQTPKGVTEAAAAQTPPAG